MAVVDVLRASQLFKGFTDTGLQILGGIAVERAFPFGSPLFVENMVADTVLIIGSGQVRLSAKSSSGDEVELGEVGPGEALGGLSLIQPGQRMCSATAASGVLAAEIRHADFQKLLAQKPQACVKLLMNVCADVAARLQDNREGLRALVGRK
jgi:CRP/FNR family cyclic AMP-dependent transcriptional regulator